jgi:hypothetical protein
VPPPASAVRPRDSSAASAATTAAARVAGAAWSVLFRSADPAIWDKEVRRGKDDFALKLSTAAPKDVKWLRLTCAANGKAVIIPMTSDALRQRSFVSAGIGWEGRARHAQKAYHLGIGGDHLKLDRRGAVAVGSEGHDRRGWGFGRQHLIDREQAYTWAGEDLKGPVAFEIAVKATALSEAEKKLVLTPP